MTDCINGMFTKILDDIISVFFDENERLFVMPVQGGYQFYAQALGMVIHLPYGKYHIRRKILYLSSPSHDFTEMGNLYFPSDILDKLMVALETIDSYHHIHGLGLHQLRRA